MILLSEDLSICIQTALLYRRFAACNRSPHYVGYSPDPRKHDIAVRRAVLPQASFNLRSGNGWLCCRQSYVILEAQVYQQEALRRRCSVFCLSKLKRCDRPQRRCFILLLMCERVEVGCVMLHCIAPFDHSHYSHSLGLSNSSCKVYASDPE